MNVYVSGQKRFGRAVLELCLELGHQLLGVSASPTKGEGRAEPDHLRAATEIHRLPWIPAGQLRAETLPKEADVILAAHSHDFISRATRLRTTHGALGYHPSLLPLYRGRDVVIWTVRMGDRASGGTAFWLNDAVDGGDVAAQDWVLAPPGITPSGLWRRHLFPMGARLFREVLADLERGEMVRIPEERKLATWEPSYGRAPLRRPDIPVIGAGPAGFRTVRDRALGSQS